MHTRKSKKKNKKNTTCASAVESTDIQGRSQTFYTTPWIASSAMGLKLGVFVFLLVTAHAKTNAKQIYTSTIFARHVERFTCVYLHAQTAVDAVEIQTWQTTVILIMEKTQRPPIWAPCWDMMQVLGSPL